MESSMNCSDMDCHKAPSPCLQLLEATTKFDYEEFILRWKVSVPLLKTRLEDPLPLESPVFVGGDKGQHSWQLSCKRVYYSGSVGSCVGYVYALGLTLVAIGNVSQEENGVEKYVKANASMSANKQEEEELLKIKIDYATISLQSFYPGYLGMSVTVKENEFWDETKGYIVDNFFTLCCRIVVFYGVKNNSSVSKLVLVGSGESYTCTMNKMDSVERPLKNALGAADFADVQIVTETKSFSAHKVILAAYSPVFAAMLKSNMQENISNSVEIKDFSGDVVEAMLEFIYTGSILNFTHETEPATAAKYLKISDKYELLDLKAQCEQFLCLGIKVNDAVELLQVADLHNCDTLKAAVVQFIFKNKKEVCGTESYKKLADPSILAELFKLI